MNGQASINGGAVSSQRLRLILGRINGKRSSPVIQPST
jgi:hypothetical protein